MPCPTSLPTIDQLREAGTELRESATQRGFRALNKVVIPAVKAGLASPLPIGAGLVVLETTGRVSGKPRQVPLVATRIGKQVTVSTVRRSSQWTKNVDASPDVAVWVGGRKRPATATVAPGALTTASLTLT